MLLKILVTFLKIFEIFYFSESTPEGRRVTKLDQILLNGNNITMVSFGLVDFPCKISVFLTTCS